MARINLDTMTLKDLLGLQSAVEAAIAEKKAEERQALKAKVAEMAAQAGLSIDDLLGRAGKARSKVAPKYFNPANPAEVWSGRGRRPRWVEAALKKGVKIEKLLIA